MPEEASSEDEHSVGDVASEERGLLMPPRSAVRGGGHLSDSEADEEERLLRELAIEAEEAEEEVCARGTAPLPIRPPPTQR